MDIDQLAKAAEAFFEKKGLRVVISDRMSSEHYRFNIHVNDLYTCNDIDKVLEDLKSIGVSAQHGGHNSFYIFALKQEAKQEAKEWDRYEVWGKCEQFVAQNPHLFAARPELILVSELFRFARSIIGPEATDLTKCDVPPKGWDCTRPVGHDGPCAAWPK